MLLTIFFVQILSASVVTSNCSNSWNAKVGIDWFQGVFPVTIQVHVNVFIKVIVINSIKATMEWPNTKLNNNENQTITIWKSNYQIKNNTTIRTLFGIILHYEICPKILTSMILMTTLLNPNNILTKCWNTTSCGNIFSCCNIIFHLHTIK